jgi:hypothetical protein
LRQILDGNLENGLTGAEQGRSLLTLPLNILTGIVIGVVATSCLALSVLTIKLRREFGWERYRFLGADLQIRKYYTRFQVYECICFFSAFFCAGFGIQVSRPAHLRVYTDDSLFGLVSSQDGVVVFG